MIKTCLFFFHVICLMWMSGEWGERPWSFSLQDPDKALTIWNIAYWRSRRKEDSGGSHNGNYTSAWKKRWFYNIYWWGTGGEMRKGWWRRWPLTWAAGGEDVAAGRALGRVQPRQSFPCTWRQIWCCRPAAVPAKLGFWTSKATAHECAVWLL